MHIAAHCVNEGGHFIRHVYSDEEYAEVIKSGLVVAMFGEEDLREHAWVKDQTKARHEDKVHYYTIYLFNKIDGKEDIVVVEACDESHAIEEAMYLADYDPEDFCQLKARIIGVE